MAKRAHRQLRSIAKAMAQLFACFTVFALLLVTVRAGETYFACARMGVVHPPEHACCARASQPKTSGPACETRSCCQPFALNGLHTLHASASSGGGRAGQAEIAGAPWVGTLPAPTHFAQHCDGGNAPLRSASRIARAEPPPKPPTPPFLRVYLI